MERRLSAEEGVGTMFQGWGFLLVEVWILIALALLIGLFVGWVIWGRAPAVMGKGAASSNELARLRADLAAEQARARDCQAELARLQTEAGSASAEAEAFPSAETVADTNSGTAEAPGIKPATLSAPRDGAPDDLKRIKGIGPKLEALCNRLGFWHYDQIAGWSDAEIAWVDANLETFKGRVTRDDWVAQAKVLAAEKG